MWDAGRSGKPTCGLVIYDPDDHLGTVVPLLLVLGADSFRIPLAIALEMEIGKVVKQDGALQAELAGSGVTQIPLDGVLGVEKAVANPVESVERYVEQAVAEDVRQRCQRDVLVEGVLAYMLRHAANDKCLRNRGMRGAESETAQQPRHPKFFPSMESRQPTKWDLTWAVRPISSRL